VSAVWEISSRQYERQSSSHLAQWYVHCQYTAELLNWQL